MTYQVTNPRKVKWTDPKTGWAIAGNKTIKGVSAELAESESFQRAASKFTPHIVITKEAVKKSAKKTTAKKEASDA